MALILACPPVWADQHDPETDANQEDESSEVALDRITVTGTRIKRVDVEGALPVTVIDREEIELSGEISAADFLRNLSFNSFGSLRPQSWAEVTTQGASEIDLRGLGPGRSLVLINGRRMPKNPLNTQAQDLGTIPMGAIERIEILSDGASAIYGSDAIGGIVNIITRKDFEGTELMIGVSEIDAGNGGREMGSVVFGASSSSTRLIGGVSWNGRDISFARDFDFSYLAGASTGSNNFTTVTIQEEGPFAGELADNRNFTAIPGACEDSDAFFLRDDPRSLSGQSCRYNFALVAADEASTHNRALFLRGSHEINADWQFWMNADASVSYSFGRYAPLPLTSFFFGDTGYGTPLPEDSPNNPTNPDSPLYDPAFGPNVLVNWWHRFDSLGPRDAEQDAKVYTMQAGATGWIGSAEVDFGMSRVKNKIYNLNQNILLGDVALRLIADGSYDLGDPDGNPPEVLLQMKKSGVTVGVYDQDEYFASIAWDMFETSAGPVQWFLGAEQREERYQLDFDYLEKYSERATRDSVSVSFETLVHLSDDLEFSLAGRHDDYSDFGSDFSPKIALRWRVNDDLVMRFSWGEGFRVPELSISAAPPSSSDLAFVQDPQSCAAIGDDNAECTLLVPAQTIVSPALSSEKSNQYALGFAWQPSDWFNGSIDYYRIELKEAIDFFFGLDLVKRDNAGEPLPPGLSISRYPPTGEVLRVVQGYSNLGGVDTSGVDINTRVNFDFGPGRLSSNLQLGYVFDYEVRVDDTQDARNEVGDAGRPQSRATLSNHYEWGDFGLAWNVNYIADQDQDRIDRTGEEYVEHVPSWVTHDLQFNYYTPWDGRVSLGAQNVLSRVPRTGVGDTVVRAYDFELFNGFGRIWYFRYTQVY